MLNKMKALLAATAVTGVIAFTCNGTAQAASQELIDAAKKEGKVVWYTALVVNQVVRPLAEAFQAKYGIKVEFVSALWQEQALRMINEGKTGKVQGDIFDGPPAFEQVYAAGFVEPYLIPSAADYPAAYKDPKGLWTAHSLQPTGIAVNTDLVQEKDYPTSYEDLLDPKWKGRMAWTTSTSAGGPPGFIGMILDHMGEEKGMEYLRKLAKQDIINVPSNQRVVLDKAVAGEVPLVLSVYNYHIPISQAKGAPIKWIKIDPLSGHLGTFSLIKDAPHPNAARLLLDFIMSEEGETIQARAGYIPAHPAVPSEDPSLKPEGNYTFSGIAPDRMMVEGPRWVKIYRELFE